MNQMSLESSARGFDRKTKREPKRQFLDEMSPVAPWTELVALIEPHASARGAMSRRLLFDVHTMPRTYFLRRWFGLREPAMRESLYEMRMFGDFASLDSNQWHFRMQTHIGAIVDLVLVHSVASTAANAYDVTQAKALPPGGGADVFADAGRRRVIEREEIRARHSWFSWHIAMMPGKRKAMDKLTPTAAHLDQLEQIQARMRSKVKHPFRVIKRKFDCTQLKYRGLARKRCQPVEVFALLNLCMVRKIQPALVGEGMSALATGHRAAIGLQTYRNPLLVRTSIASSETSTCSPCLSDGCTDVSKRRKI